MTRATCREDISLSGKAYMYDTRPSQLKAGAQIPLSTSTACKTCFSSHDKLKLINESGYGPLNLENGSSVNSDNCNAPGLRF